MAANSTQKMLEVEGLSKSYGSVQALKDITFAQERSSILGLVGDNGAGKSTLLKILNGFEQPDEGTFYLNGDPVTFDSPEDAREAGVAMTYENFALVNEAPVWENFFMGRERVDSYGPINKIRAKEMKEEVDQKLDAYGFDFDIYKKTSELSGGQRRILVVSRAIESDPDLLLLDEPYRGLSERAINQLNDILLEFKKEGLIIITSQWYSPIEDLIDEVMIFRLGELVGKFPNQDIDREECTRLMMEGAPEAGGV